MALKSNDTRYYRRSSNNWEEYYIYDEDNNSMGYFDADAMKWFHCFPQTRDMVLLIAEKSTGEAIQKYIIEQELSK